MDDISVLRVRMPKDVIPFETDDVFWGYIL